MRLIAAVLLFNATFSGVDASSVIFDGGGGSAISGLTNPLVADLDADSNKIICDDADVGNDSYLDCSTNDAPAIYVNGALAVTFNDTEVKLAGSNLVCDGAAAQPACAVGTRGTVSMTNGGAGVADQFEVCRKDAADVYAYQDLFTGGGLSNPLTADLDFDGYDLIIDADGNSEYTFADDSSTLTISTGETYLMNGVGLTLNDTTANQDSPYISMIGDIGGVNVESRIQTDGNTDPSMELWVTDDNISQTLTQIASFYDNLVSIFGDLRIANANFIHWASRTRLYSTVDGYLNLTKNDGTTDVVLSIEAEDRLAIRRDSGEGAPLRLPPILAATEAKPTCDATQVGYIWVVDVADVDTAEICLQTAVTPTYAWVNMIASGAAFSGDLNGNHLNDTSDTEIGITEGTVIAFGSGADTAIDGDDSDGLLKLTTNAGTSFSRVTLGPSGTNGTGVALWMDGDDLRIKEGDATALSGSGNNDATVTVGTLNAGTNVVAGTYAFTATGTNPSVKVGSGGSYGFTANSSDASPAIDVGIKRLQDGIISFSDGSNLGAWQAGSAATTKPTCNSTNRGVWYHLHATTNQPDIVEVCVKETTGAADTYAYRSAVAASSYAHWYTQDNATATTIAAQTTWYNVALGAGAAINVQNGFSFTAPYVTALTGSGGRYKVDWHVSASSATAHEYEFTISTYNNPTYTEKQCYSHRTTSTGSAVGAVSGGCIIDITDGHSVYLRVQQIDATPTDITIKDANINLVRL